MDSDKNTHDELAEPLASEVMNEESVKELVDERNEIEKEEALKNVDLSVNQQLDDGTSMPEEYQEEVLEVEAEPVKLENSSIEKIEKVDESPFGNDGVVELVDDIIEKQQVEEKEREEYDSVNDEKDNEKEPNFELEEEVNNIEEIEENGNLEHNEIENQNQVIQEIKETVVAKAKTQLDDDEEEDDEVIKLYDENDHQRDALDDEVEENSGQDVELEHEIEFINSSHERGNRSPPSFRSNQMRFHRKQRGLTERSELSCIPELTQESVLRNSTISDDRPDVLNSMTVTKSQMSEFKTLKEFEGTAERTKTQENQFLTENDEQQQPKGLTESKSSNIETINLLKNKDFLAVPKKMPRAKSQEGIKSSEVVRVNQQEGNGEEILHHIDEASHESKSSVEAEPEGVSKNPDLAFTFGRQQLQAELDVEKENSQENDESHHHHQSLEKPVIKINSEQVSKTEDLMKNLSGISMEYPMSETVHDLRSATEMIGYSAPESNISSTVAFRKNVSKTEQPEQEYDCDNVVEKMNNSNLEKNRSAGLTSKYGEDEYANEEFESLTQTASVLHNKLSKDQTRLSAFQSAHQSGHSLIHQESQEYYGEVEQRSQSSQNQYRLPDPESFDEYDEMVEEVGGVEVLEEDETTKVIENKGEQGIMSNEEDFEKALSIIKKAESFSASEKGHFEEKSLIEPEVLVLEKEEKENEIVPVEVPEKENASEKNFAEQVVTHIVEQENEIASCNEELNEVEGKPVGSENEEKNLAEETSEHGQEVIEKTEKEIEIVPSKEEVKDVEGEPVLQTENPMREKEEQDSCIILSRVEVKGESSSKKDLKQPVKVDHNAKLSASPESQPSSRGGERVEPLHSRGEELIQKALSDFSEDIPLDIQKGAVPKITPRDDETLPSVIQRGATSNPEVTDPMYGLEELTARGVEEMKAAGILTPKSEVGSEKKGLSQENIIKLTRRVPAPVMKRRSSSKIRAKTKSFIITEDQAADEEKKVLPEMQIRFTKNVTVKRDQISAPKSRPPGSKSPQVRHSVIQKKENGQFIIQNIDVIVPEIQRDDPKKYPIDMSPTRLYPISRPNGRAVKIALSGRKSKSPSQSPELLSSSVLVETDKKKRVRPNNKKNNSESSVSLNMETEDEKMAAFERDHRRRINGREKEKHNSQAYYLKRGAQDTTRAFQNNHILEPLNHSRAEYPSRVSDLENEEGSIYTPKGYNPYRQARHSSISHQRVDELEETIQIPRYNKDYRKAGIPEDVSYQIRKTIAKQKEILKRADIYNPYNPYWTKKMLNDHFGVDIEPSNDSDHNRWKLRRIKQNRHDTQPRDSQQDVPTSQPEEDKVIFSQNFPPWDSSPRRQEVRRPSPNQKRSGSNPHRRLSPMLIDPQRREQQQIKINVNVNNFLIQSSELYKGAIAMYSSPKNHQEEAVEEGTILSSPMARPKYLQGAKRNSVRRHRPMNDINSARGEVFHVRNSMEYPNN